MSTNAHDYIIEGGEKGKSRLDTLSEVLRPYTLALLEKQGLGKGMRFLDLGCGGGNVSMMASDMVGDTGKVIAVDADANMVTLAQKDTGAHAINNVSFSVMNANDIDYSDEFEIAYSRFLLSHLRRPFEVLQKMIASVKPGGKVIVEDVHFSGHFCYPECDAFDWYVEYYTTLARNNGQDANIGPQLFSMFRKAGLGNVGIEVIQPCANSGPAKQMAYLTLERIKDNLIAQKMATADIVSQMLTELKSYTDDDQTIMSLPRIFRVWGESLG